MKRNAEARLIRKRQEFIERTKRIYPDIDFELFIGKPSLAVRVNTLKCDRSYGPSMEWAPSCYESTLDRAELTQLPEFESGEIYLQNPSSFIPPIVLDPRPGDKILDLCAAPGGKASHVAALANNDIELWVNDNSKSRLLRMKQNLQRLNVKVHKETMFAIERAGRELPHGYFDRIMLDAPCSGEGALSLGSDKSFEFWSVAQIKRLQKLQKQAIAVAWELLKPGGVIVYSTCTMAPEENEAVINWLLRKKTGAQLMDINLDIADRVPAITSWLGKEYSEDVSRCLRIKPSQSMEAFFVARIVKGLSRDLV